MRNPAERPRDILEAIAAIERHLDRIRACRGMTGQFSRELRAMAARQ